MGQNSSVFLMPVMASGKGNLTMSLVLSQNLTFLWGVTVGSECHLSSIVHEVCQCKMGEHIKGLYGVEIIADDFEIVGFGNTC